jgi:hypothetical protein
MVVLQRARGLSGQTLGDHDQLKKGRGVWGMLHVGKGHHGFAWGRRIGGSLARGARLDPGEAKVLLGRRRRRHPSLDAFTVIVGPTETRQRAGSPFVPSCDLV